jgi:hypothetical protein
MSEILRKFREEHGRGPDTRELLEIRGHVARELGVEVATVEALEESAASAASSAAEKRKQAPPSEAEDDGKPSKHVKFQASLEPGADEDEGDDDDSPDDGKPPFKEGNGEKEPNEDASDKPED